MRIKKTFLFTLLTLFFISRLYSQNLYLKINGKDSLETKLLDSLDYNKSFKDFKSLQKEIDTTFKKVQRLGFIESSILFTKKNNDSTYISTFDLNKKYYTIYIYRKKTPFSDDILEPISQDLNDSYFVLEMSKLENTLNYLNSKLSENGLPFASLQLTNLKKRDKHNLQADLITSSNKKRTINNIVIKGYEKFPKTYLKHFLKIKQGYNFNLNAIKQKTELINNLPFANQVRPPEVLFSKDSTSLYLYLEKVKSNSFDGFLGFGTNETTNKLEFDGYLNLNLVNSLNFGEKFQLNYKSDESDQKTFDVKITLPYLFGSPLGTELQLNIFKKDSSFTTVSQSANLFYQFNAQQKLFLGIDAIQSNNLLETENFQDNIQDINTSFYNIKYEYIKPQNYNYLFPINFSLQTKFGFGNRTFENEKESQQLIELETFKIINLNKSNSVFLRLSSKTLLSDNLFDNELLRFGGINSIRGFEENTLLSSTYAVLNTEYRYQLNNNIYLHSIIDAAYLENDITSSKEKLFGFGFGFGLLTKAGLLKFNYANGKTEDQQFKLSNSKIHLSLNARF